MEGQIQKLRDEAVRSLRLSSSVDGSLLQSQRHLTEDQDEEANCGFDRGAAQQVLQTPSVNPRIMKCVNYAHVSFNCEAEIEQMSSILDEEDCEDDSNVQNPNVIASITNVMDDLQQRFKELHF